MSLYAEIFQFPGRQDAKSGLWSNQERADVYRCLDAFARHGLTLEASSGLSDEGDPWFALEEPMSGDVLVHLARIDGFYAVHVADGEHWRAEDVRAALGKLDFSAIAGLVGEPQVEGSADDGDDPHEGRTFLRVVSSVVALLAADAIANILQGRAEAATSASLADDADEGMVAHAAFAALDFSTLVPQRADKATVQADGLGHDEKAAAPLAATQATSDHDTPAAQPATAHKIFAAGDVHTDAAPASALGTIKPFAQESLAALTVPAPDRAGAIHIAYGPEAKLTATDRADVFLVLLGPKEGGGGTLHVEIDGLNPSQDILVVEQNDADGTSSGVTVDLSQLQAAGAALTLVGQPAPSHDPPFAGG
jgi:hypothetical protein